MPIYEYRCANCGHVFEKRVKLNAPSPDCPQCEGKDTNKLVSSSSFVLKGEGWYRDGYGLSGGKGGSSSDGGGE